MAETFYYPATTTLRATSFTGTNQIYGTFPASANVQVFTSPGTWTKNAQSNVIFFECWGGGGGGGSGAPTTGGGGGGGAYVNRWLPGPLAPAPQVVTVGASVAGSTNGNPSSVGTLCVAYGGARGSSVFAGGGDGGAMDSVGTQALGIGAPPAGGTGGAATFYGGGGGGALSTGAGGTSVWGGAGGGGGGGGVGGASVFGGPGGAGTGPGVTGGAGVFPGGGGGGGGTGGPGAAGYVRITSF